MFNECGLEVSKFELQSRYSIPCRVNTIEKGLNSLIPQLWIKKYCCSIKILLRLNNPLSWSYLLRLALSARQDVVATWSPVSELNSVIAA